MYCQKCGLKLQEEASECDICGYPVAGVNRGPIGWIVVVFMLVTVLASLVGRQTPPREAAVAANPINQTQTAAGSDAVPSGPTVPQTKASSAQLMAQANLPQGFQLVTVYSDLGPMLLEADAIDYDHFVQTYERAGRPLTEGQLAILREGSDEPILINQEDAYFLLNFFWAVGLTNENPLLTEGLIVENSGGDVGRYASIGGWTIGQKPATALYASTRLIALMPEQQRLVEGVAEKVYRPCCNNHTAFPDCNHGMAMLGLLELMASQGATEDEMFTAAKYMNAAWFPQQALETAVFFQATMDLNYAEVDGRMAVGPEVFSGSRFQQMHQWLAEGGELPQDSQGGNSCGV